MTYLVTGAAGQLGKLVIAALKTRVPADQIVGLVRRDDAKAELEAQGVQARLASYDDPDALRAAFDGVDRLLLISGSEVGRRKPQHVNVIEAAKAAGVGFIAYTSLLRTDTSPMALAVEHLATEEALKASGLAYTLLRNGWYSENLLGALQTDLELGQHFGCAGTGRFSAAPRKDFAEAAAIVLSDPAHDGEVLELAGDEAVTLADFAAILSETARKPVSYTDMPQAAYAQALAGAGLPGPLAEVLADSDAKAADGWLFDDSRTLSGLIGHPTEALAETVKRALS